MSGSTATTIDRRAELAEAAYRLIADGGLDGLSIRLLARAVGAKSTGLVSHYFVDRAEIVAAALDHAAAVMMERARPHADPVEVIVSILPTDDTSLENWRFALAVRAGALNDPTLASFERAIHRYWHDHLPGALADAGRLPDDADPHPAIDHLVAVIDGIALRAVLAPDDWPAGRQRRHVELAMSALEHSPDLL